MKVLIEAIEFAAHAHGKQTRKYSGLPYIQHPIRVMHKLYQHTNAKCSGNPVYENVEYLGWISRVGLPAAICHDVLEDTAVTHKELSAGLGIEVATLVDELTKKEDAALPRKERKRLEVERLSTVSSGAKLIKLLDRQDNLEDLIRSGCPAEWVSMYTKESRLLVDVIGLEYPSLRDDIVKIIDLLERSGSRDAGEEVNTCL